MNQASSPLKICVEKLKIGLCRDSVLSFAKTMAFVLKQDIFNRDTVSANFFNQLVTFNLKTLGSFAPWTTSIGLTIRAGMRNP